jgi:hypothetical protein
VVVRRRLREGHFCGQRAKDYSAAASGADTSSQRYTLPKNLRHAVKLLSDGELEELFEVTFDEAKRRGRLPPRVETELTPSLRRLGPTSADNRTSLKSH